MDDGFRGRRIDRRREGAVLAGSLGFWRGISWSLKVQFRKYTHIFVGSCHMYHFLRYFRGCGYEVRRSRGEEKPFKNIQEVFMWRRLAICHSRNFDCGILWVS